MLRFRMPRPVAPLLLLLFCCASAASVQTSEWKEYPYSEDGFAISAPSDPRIQKDIVPMADGNVEIHYYSIPLPGDCGWMIVTYTLNDADTRAPQQVLIDARDNALESVHARLISEMPVSIDGYMGVQIELEADKYRARNRYYVVGRRMYQLLSIAPMEKPIPRDTDRFYRSFRLLQP